jgi:hypothetical protein
MSFVSSTHLTSQSFISAKSSTRFLLPTGSSHSCQILSRRTIAAASPNLVWLLPLFPSLKRMLSFGSPNVLPLGRTSARSFSRSATLASASKVEGIVDSISSLTLLEAAELVTALKVSPPLVPSPVRQKEEEEVSLESAFCLPLPFAPSSASPCGMAGCRPNSTFPKLPCLLLPLVPLLAVLLRLLPRLSQRFVPSPPFFPFPSSFPFARSASLARTDILHLLLLTCSSVGGCDWGDIGEAKREDCIQRQAGEDRPCR